MLRRISPIKCILLLLDLTTIWMASYFTIWLRYESNVTYEITAFQIDKFLIIGLIGSIVLPFNFKSRDLYKHALYCKADLQISQIVKSLLMTFYAVVIIFFFLRGNYIQHSRYIISIFFISLLSLLIFNRVVLFRRFVLPRLQDSKLFKTRILIVGAGEAGQKLLTKIMNEGLLYDVVGFLDDDPAKRNFGLFGKRVLGKIDDLESVLTEFGVDEIVIAINSIDFEKIIDIFTRCKKYQRRISIASRHFEVVSKEAVHAEVETIPSATFNYVDVPGYKEYLKTLCDKVIALSVIVFFMPVWICIAVLIKATSKGPVFFKTSVIGKNGKPFIWYKFRTMYHSSDDLIHRKHVADIILNGRNGKKLLNDPRITKIGYFLRKYSIDEFPQLINVLRGEMSLVGPRPCLPYEYELYKEWHKKRFSVTPGVTGLWQVFGRNKVTFDEMVVLDIYYSENYSFWLDFRILFNTLKVVLLGVGGA